MRPRLQLQQLPTILYHNIPLIFLKHSHRHGSDPAKQFHCLRNVTVVYICESSLIRHLGITGFDRNLACESNAHLLRDLLNAALAEYIDLLTAVRIRS